MDFAIDYDDMLLTPPVSRAAYSDRTAWLMAVMSLLAYAPFDEPYRESELEEIAQCLAGSKNKDDIFKELQKLVLPREAGGGRATLEGELAKVGFELVELFSIKEPFRSDTQGFIARVDVGASDGEREKFLVLSFRGTEPKKALDIKTDLDAVMIEVDGIGDDQAKVHRGFMQSFETVRDRINGILRQDENKGLPVFVTGHSLGGALAIVATRYIANRSLGACYTFGGPRVGNEVFGDQIFTPIYRVVNASDVVPALPPEGQKVLAVMFLVGLIPVVGNWLKRQMRRFADFKHLGDMRHLSSVSAVRNAEAGRDEFPGLRLRSQPTLYDRWWTNGVLSFFVWGEPVRNHDIGLYIAKLAYYARKRAGDKHALNPRRPASPAA